MNIKRILVVNVNWVGDVIFSSPVFRTLRERYPDAQICCLAVPRVKDVAESLPGVDEVILYDEDGKHKTPFGKLALILKLRSRKFDIAFILHRSLTRALLMYFAGIPMRVGYDEKNRRRFLTHVTEFLDGIPHRSDYYIQVLESYGIEVKNRSCQLQVAQKAEIDVERALRAHGIRERDHVVVVNPGGNWDLKRWPPEYFGKLVRQIGRIKDVKTVISGAAKDAEILKPYLNGSPDVVDMTGQTDLKQLMALMKRANIVVSSDSGPLHLASGVGTDVIGIFGPTRPEITGPRGGGRTFVLQKDVGCNQEACYFLQCPDNICMKSITTDDVTEIIQKLKN